MNDESDDLKLYASLEFKVGDNVLIAEASPYELEEALDADAIKSQLRDAGFGSHELDEEQIAQLVEMSKENSSEKLNVEPHTDACFDIEVSTDKLTVNVTYTPPFCGKPLTVKDISDVLIELAIPDEKISLKDIQSLLESEDKITVALIQGLAAINGEDGYLEILFQKDLEQAPKMDSKGDVDHYETHTYVTLPSNAQLMRRCPPTDGTPGENVFGEVLEPEPGLDVQFELNETVKLSKDDPNLMLSDKSGHPIADNNTVIMDDTLTLENASLETGNVHFDGSVHIKGDVKPNVEIEATGDIFVNGLVDNAELISGKNITVDGGVVSSQLKDDEDHHDFQFGCKIQAKNNIQLKYCNSILAEAQGSIIIENYSLHSHLVAQNKVVAGVNNGKGILLGGEIHAEDSIQAKVIGSEAYVKTELFCANTMRIKHKYIKSKNKISRITNELNMLNNVLEQIKALGSPSKVGQVTLEKAKKIFKEIQELKQDYKAEKKILKKYKAKIHPAKPNLIKVEKTCYPNTHIVINDVQSSTVHTHGQCIVKKSDDELEFN